MFSVEQLKQMLEKTPLKILFSKVEINSVVEEIFHKYQRSDLSGTDIYSTSEFYEEGEKCSQKKK